MDLKTVLVRLIRTRAESPPPPGFHRILVQQGEPFTASLIEVGWVFQERFTAVTLVVGVTGDTVWVEADTQHPDFIEGLIAAGVPAAAIDARYLPPTTAVSDVRNQSRHA